MKYKLDTKNLEYCNDVNYMVIDRADLKPARGYTVVDIESELGMKSVGRVYFKPAENLDYPSGHPVEMPYIGFGENGTCEKYLKPGVQVYTEEQVKDIIEGKLYVAEPSPQEELKEAYALLEKMGIFTKAQKESIYKKLTKKIEMLEVEDDTKI